MSIREKLGLKDKGGKNKTVTDDFQELEDKSAFSQPAQLEAGAAPFEEATQGLEAGDFQREHEDNVDPDGPDYDADAKEGEDPHNYEGDKPQTRVAKMTPLAKNYLAASLDSLCRIPNSALTEAFRARLNTFREFIGLVKKQGVKGEVPIIAAVVSVLAVDGTGKIDAITMLRQLVGQVIWLGSMDITRINNRERGRDEQRMAPAGMDNMSDHSDAIAGFVSPDTNPTAELTDELVFGAVLEVHGVLSTIADMLPDNEDERIYLRLESGLSYLDERIEDPAMPGGYRYEPVHDIDKAMDIQHVRNAESMRKREIKQAETRTKRLAALANLFNLK